MNITNPKELFDVICKCYENPILNSCIVGRGLGSFRELKTFGSPKKSDEFNWYYEFELVYGPFHEQKKKYTKEFFRPLTEEEVVNDIFHTITSIGWPFVFDFKKAKFIKKREII